MYYVVGSGPAGISCAQALLAAGKEATILDSGVQLEPDRRAAVEALAASDPTTWTKENTAFMRAGMSSGKSGIPEKLVYGSNYTYRPVSGSTSITCEGPDTKPSYALGGLSTVWGSAVMPYRQQDIANWPITVSDLEPGYRAVQKWMPFSAQTDDLAGLFPLYRDDLTSLPMSRQASAVLSDLTRNRTSLNAKGVHFGQSRLAVNATKCVSCGLCMYGCPRSLIYSTDQTLSAMSVKYISGVTLQSVEESGDSVTLNAINQDGSKCQFTGERAFLGAGLLNTTAILLRSLGLYDTPVNIVDSQYFLLPLLRFRGISGVSKERLHTLAQLFVDILDESISPYTVHLQTYTYNDLFRDPVMAALGPLAPMFPVETFLGRLLLFQGYLHSDHSPSITANLSRSNTLTLTSVPNPETKKRVNQVAQKLTKLVGQTGVMPLRPLLQMGKPGRGFHSGGSFPMGTKTDILGRPSGLQRVHAVDSSVLPSIPASTVTYTVMANAYRIGSLAANE